MGPFFFILGWILIGLSTIAGIGYGLYQWGGEGLPLSVSAWMGFKVWVVMVIGGLVSMVLGTANS